MPKWFEEYLRGLSMYQATELLFWIDIDSDNPEEETRQVLIDVMASFGG